MKKVFIELISRFNIAKGKISEFEYKSTKVTQPETQIENGVYKSGTEDTSLVGQCQMTSVQVVRVPEGKEREWKNCDKYTKRF